MENLNSGLLAIQGAATGVVVIMGVISACIVAAKNLPSVDDPAVKNRLIGALLTILAIIAIVAAMIWALPWVWSLFVG